MSKHTPAPWFVRTLERNGEILNCFVAAKDVNGFAYDAEIMGDDEYHDGIERKLADARLIAAAPDLLEALKNLCDQLPSNPIPLSTYFAKDELLAARAALAKAQGESNE